MLTIKKPPTVEEAKIMAERVEKHSQLKQRSRQVRDDILDTSIPAEDKPELQQLLVGIETEIAAFKAETHPVAEDPFKVVEDAAAVDQKKEDKRKEAEDLQQATLSEMRRKDLQGISY